MKTLIAIPCGETIHVDFVTSLSTLRIVGAADQYFLKGSLVYDARNRLAQKAVEDGYDYILWLDSDMVFEPDLMQKLMADIKGRDMVCGIFFTRKPPYKPCVYSRVAYTLDLESGRTIPEADPFFDYPKDSIFEVEACGFGAVLMRTDLVKRIYLKKGLPFTPIIGFGEDLSFCLSARDAGAKIFCDSRVKVGHIGSVVINEEKFMEVQNATS